jgi:hypothetical protein
MNKIDNEKLKLLQNLGMDFECSLIYLTLIRGLSLTVLQISRIANIERAKVYRRLSEMIAIGYVVEITENNKSQFKIADPDILLTQFKQKELQFNEISTGIASLYDEIKRNGVQKIEDEGIRVTYFKGIDGIKKQFKNILDARGEVLVYNSEKSIQIKQTLKGIGYDAWLDGFGRLELNVLELSSRNGSKKLRRSEKDFLLGGKCKWETRYDLQGLISLNCDMYLWNGVVSYFHYIGSEVNGVEIYNGGVFGLQKRLFEGVWKMSGS